MKILNFSLATAAVLASALFYTTAMTACQQPDADPCPNSSTYIGDSGARHVIDVELPFAPGPVAVLSTRGEAASLSSSSKLWVGEDGTKLFALNESQVWSVDLATGEPNPLSDVPYRASRLAGSNDDSTLLVTDHVRSSVWIIDETCAVAPVEVPVGRGPSSLALGPGQQIAYVSNEWDKSLSLIETGIGSHVSVERTVIVAARSEGTILLLDGDGRVREQHEGLPNQLRELTVLPGGRILAATYSEVLVTGAPEVPGDGEIVLSEGVLLLDLQTGESSLHGLSRDAHHQEITLARPTGLAVVDDGQRLAVGLPGWNQIAVLDVSTKSSSFGTWTRTVDVPGSPYYVAAAELGPDWLYVLDTDTGRIITLDALGATTQTLQIR